MSERNKPAATMADIAKVAGVSVSTVSRALSGSTLVASAKVDEILRVAREAGYVVNATARNLRLKRTQTIGVVVPLAHEAGQPLTDPFLSQMLIHLADEITVRGYGMFLQKVLTSGKDWLQHLVASGRADGFIVIGQSTERETLQTVGEAYLPLVVWGGQLVGDSYCTIGTDNRGGTRAVTEHLLATGRKRLVFLGNPKMPELGLRYAGYAEAVTEAATQNPEIAPPRSVPVHLTATGAYDAVHELIGSGLDFDGLVCASDVIALSALRALTSRGLNVPQDVAVTGYDDIPLAAHANPSLTTVHQDLPLAAATLVERLFRRMDGHNLPSITLPSRVVVRESSAPVTGA